MIILAAQETSSQGAHVWVAPLACSDLPLVRHGTVSCFRHRGGGTRPGADQRMLIAADVLTAGSVMRRRRSRGFAMRWACKAGWLIEPKPHD